MPLAIKDIYSENLPDSNEPISIPWHDVHIIATQFF